MMKKRSDEGAVEKGCWWQRRAEPLCCWLKETRQDVTFFYAAVDCSDKAPESQEVDRRMTDCWAVVGLSLDWDGLSGNENQNLAEELE